jgi:hypothetical protein
MKFEYWAVQAAKNDYYTVAAGVREALPAALGDPMIRAAVLQVEMGEKLLRARLDELVGDDV